MKIIIIITIKYYNRIDIDIYKQLCVYFCHYWYFLHKGFRFQPTVCNDVHDALMISIDNINIAILYIHGADNRCIIFGISKNKAVYIKKL